MIALLVMTDGRRDCISRTIASANDHLQGTITRRLINDDSADPAHREWLAQQFGPLGFELIPPAPTRQGFGGAIRHAWDFLRAVAPEPFVFHLEDDFTFNRPVNLDDVAFVLAENPHLVQLAFRRQPWNAEERAAGGIVEQHPADYCQVMNQRGVRWLEHRRFFTTNPSLYRRTLLEYGWPDGQHSEGMFTHRLLANPKLRFGFWGSRDSGEWVTHIGNERVGTGY